LTTVIGVVVSVIAVLTFAFSRLDKRHQEIITRQDKDRAELTLMVTTIATALGVRLDKLDDRMNGQDRDLSEIKGMAKASQARDQRHDRHEGS